MTNVISGSTTKPMASRQLASILENRLGADSTLYIGYPIFGTPDGAFPFDALLLSPSHGAIAFDIVEGKNIGDYQGRQDNIFSKLQSKLLQYPALVKKRNLQVNISVVTFAPAATLSSPMTPDYPACDSTSLEMVLDGITWAEDGHYSALCSAIQSLSNIRKNRRRRDIQKPDSRGAKLERVNDSIANLDAQQGAAVVETVDGVQRIRGLAGSGKTIVLALKVAYLHAQNPNWNIAITFNTRSLKGQFERLINAFVIEQTNEEPDWTRIHIMHSWGSPSSPEGVYYKFTRDNGASYLDFESARKEFGEGKEFNGACEKALREASAPIQSFDAILIDEAQDLPPSFLKLCYSSLRDPKRLVYAYDELQSLTNLSLPPPEELFGTDKEGSPVVRFEEHTSGQPKRDIILERCYRNPKHILVTAHALGFGIYRSKGLIQIFDTPQLWGDVGYHVAQGPLTDNKEVQLVRTTDSSPKFLDKHSTAEDLIQFHRFPSASDQETWLVDQIITNIKEDELAPDDIIVINPDPLKTRRVVAGARARLFQLGINTSLAGVSSSPDVFFEPDVVTFTGIFRAKGNEAAMVYVINAQDCFDAYMPSELTRVRNQLFTAITRSKAWVRILGIGQQMDKLIDEFNSVKENNYSLKFTYPNQEKRRQLRIVNRDMTRAERSKVKRSISELEDIIKSIDQGDILLEDLPQSMKNSLQRLLKKNP